MASQKTFLYLVTKYKKSMFMPTIFLSLFSCPQEHTNPITLMDAKQCALTLF